MPEKYNRQCTIANQRKVPVTTLQKKSSSLTAFRRRKLLASCCCECPLDLLLSCFVLASCLGQLKRKMYDQTDESLFWKQSTILENIEALKLWTTIRKH